MLRREIRAGDRLVLKDQFADRYPRLSGRVLVPNHVENDVYDVFEGIPTTPNVYQYVWDGQIEGGEHESFGRTYIDKFDRIPEWNEVIGPLASDDWPPMTVSEFRALESNLEFLKGMAKLLLRDPPWINSDAG